MLKAPFDYQATCDHYGALSWANLVPLLLLAYFLGHMVSFVSSITVEKHAAWMHGAPAKVLLWGKKGEYLDASKSQNPTVSKALHLVIFIFLLPISFVEIVAGRWLRLSRNYIRPADPLIKKAFLRAMSRLLDKMGIKVGEINRSSPWEYEVERLAIHCALERAPAHVSSLRNYVVLFGFLRAMCLIMVAVFWAVQLHFILRHDYFGFSMSFFLGSALVFICYAGYLKFQFRYYYEGIMAIIATSPLEPKE